MNDDGTTVGVERFRDTIAAVSTAAGKAAIAVVRLSGPEAGSALDALAGGRPTSRRASLRTLRDPRDGSTIDRGLVLWFPGPASATGEDMAELQLHGGRAVVAAALDALLSLPGMRAAEPGEFTRRAFAAGRLDLVEAEGLADLLAAETDAQRRQALRQSDGELSRRLDGWRDRLIGAMALIEAGIDFSDEDDVPAQVRSEARADVEALSRELAEALRDTRAERLRDGFQVAILGRPNVGKSSLLNALARRDVAIVTDAPGTTRDVLEAHLDLAGLPVVIADTAGLREADDVAEREGIRRAAARGDTADIALWIEDATAPGDDPPAFASAAIWRVANKVDLARDSAPDVRHRISVRTGEGIAELVDDIARAGLAELGGGEHLGLTRARHRGALGAAARAIDAAIANWDALPDELLAERLREAAIELGRITGRIGVEDVLGRVFAEFCIGK